MNVSYSLLDRCTILDRRTILDRCTIEIRITTDRPGRKEQLRLAFVAMVSSRYLDLARMIWSEMCFYAFNRDSTRERLVQVQQRRLEVG